MSSRLALSLFLVAVLCTAGTTRAADRLLPVSELNEQRVVWLSDASARAFDRIQAARRALARRHGFEAGQQLAHARSRIGEARSASPALAIQQEIGAVLLRLADPTRTAPRTVLDPVFAVAAAAGDSKAFGPTRRYVERARYQLYRGNRDAAIDELASAAARVPYSRLDAPLGAIAEQVDRALIEIYAGRLGTADVILAGAERVTHEVVRLASGLEPEALADVAAPPAAVPAPSVPATESEIPAEPEFFETTEKPLRDGEAPKLD